jgi:hypothetical protein
MSEVANKSRNSISVNSASKLVTNKHIKLPRIHRVGNQYKERSISHHPTALTPSETAQKIKDRKSAESSQTRPCLNLPSNCAKYSKNPDEGISKLQNLTVRNSNAHNELLSLQERMLEVKLKSMINPQKIKLDNLDSSLYDGIEKCFADSKKNLDKLMNKYTSFSVRRPFVVSPI